ncbi:ATPase [Pseudomaricurvus alkylphenolicus]|jgi:hypothetical protein|uniref:ATPase n=1 Tax=Pseudomaricurvus alkylphenolicus TaxID=1306991 RepID=UPI00141E881C|nr:ATPase [Pseudomaricurvus alkylphenolicus]NIB45024.1 ATPase [Pseudomaricurvus alkylphenolicus]
MKIDTLKDIIHWTRDYHAHLSERMMQSSIESGNERNQMLLGYLADHEKLLSEQMEVFEHSGDITALNTWCYEWMDKNPTTEPTVDSPLADMSTDQILQLVVEQHQKIIELYRYLQSRAETDSARECLSQLLGVEEHEVMTMVQGANRMQEM